MTIWDKLNFYHCNIDREFSRISQQSDYSVTVDGLQPACNASFSLINCILKHFENIFRHRTLLGNVSLELTFKTIGGGTLGRSGQNHFLFLYLVSWVNGKAPGARYEISALKEPQCVLETLFTVFGQNLWIWGKQNPAESDQVILAHLNAGSSNLELEDGEDVVILRTDVAAATEWRHGDGVGVNDGRVVAVAAINDTNSSISWRQPSGEDRNKCTCKYHLQY